jgi:hypothetical protein
MTNVQMIALSLPAPLWECRRDLFARTAGADAGFPVELRLGESFISAMLALT